jgi:two-component system sensor kinase FixL
MGMGLTISRAIVEAHGGRMWIEPAPRGRVHFSLPPQGAPRG